MYKYAIPLQYLMLKEDPIVILPLFKPDQIYLNLLQLLHLIQSLQYDV